MPDPAEAPTPLRPGPRGRFLLSLVFVVHWISVGVYLLPATAERFEVFPEPIRPTARALITPILYNVGPWTEPWLDATWTRQHWMLFAPWPNSWNVAADVVAFFPVDSTSADPGVRWRADTLPIESGESDPFPHFGKGREYRIVSDLGESGRGLSYRPWFAAALCRELRDGEGRAPEGVEVRLHWQRIVPPWADRDAPGPFTQSIGGFNCWELADRPRPWWSRPGFDPAGLPKHLRAPWAGAPW